MIASTVTTCVGVFKFIRQFGKQDWNINASRVLLLTEISQFYNIGHMTSFIALPTRGSSNISLAVCHIHSSVEDTVGKYCKNGVPNT